MRLRVKVVPPHLTHLVRCFTQRSGAIPVPENATLSIIQEALLVHKRPPARFVLYPQPPLRWTPKDRSNKHSETPDLAVVKPRDGQPFSLRIGIETKHFMEESMKGLPDADVVARNLKVRRVLGDAYFQAEDQAKAAVWGEHISPEHKLDCLLFAGPYWTHVTVGPFNTEELSVRTHTHRKVPAFGSIWFLTDPKAGTFRCDKESQGRGPGSLSGDQLGELLREWDEKGLALYLVGTIESQKKMEEIISQAVDQ